MNGYFKACRAYTSARARSITRNPETGLHFVEPSITTKLLKTAA